MTEMEDTVGELGGFEMSLKKRKGKELWNVADKKVMPAVKLSMGMSTLRDMAGDAYIASENLSTVKKLGEGAFAVVDKCIYTAEGGGWEGPVAVKRLKPSVFENETDLQSFLNETKLLRKMRHSCIVDFYGVGVTDAATLKTLEKDGKAAQDVVYLVQEFMNEGTLKSLVLKQMATARGKVYTNSQAVKWCIQIAKGLRYLHKAKPKLIHRDLKMENVLLNRHANGELLVKLADFGLCAMIDSSGHRLNIQDDDSYGEDGLLTVPSAMSVVSSYSSKGNLRSAVQASYELSGKTGSLMYMAPEVLKCQNYNEKCDIFSFGIIMYELFMRTLMLTFVSCSGEPDEVENYARSVASGCRPQIPDTIPVKIAELIRKCWAGNPDDRPSASEIVRELESMLEDEDIMNDMGQPSGCSCCAMQ